MKSSICLSQSARAASPRPFFCGSLAQPERGGDASVFISLSPSDDDGEERAFSKKAASSCESNETGRRAPAAGIADEAGRGGREAPLARGSAARNGSASRAGQINKNVARALGLLGFFLAVCSVAELSAGGKMVSVLPKAARAHCSFLPRLIREEAASADVFFFFFSRSRCSVCVFSSRRCRRRAWARSRDSISVNSKRGRRRWRLPLLPAHYIVLGRLSCFRLPGAVLLLLLSAFFFSVLLPIRWLSRPIRPSGRTGSEWHLRFPMPAMPLSLYASSPRRWLEERLLGRAACVG